MKLLLDTHIWLWYLLGDKRLSTQLQFAIAEEKTELWLSPISIWETLILAEKGRIFLVNRVVQSSDRRVAKWGSLKANAIYLYIGFLWGMGVETKYLKRLSIATVSATAIALTTASAA
ncbi:MAG: PIN domain-containing protein, partial [Cyanobacteria bacterium J06636_27]